MSETVSSRSPDEFAMSHGASQFASKGTESPESSSEIDPSEIIIPLLVKEGFIAENQITRATKIQKKLETPRKLLEILRELDFIQNDQVIEVIHKNRPTIRIGALLVALGYITESQLKIALNKQKASRSGLLGKYLLDENFISEYDLTKVLSIQLGIPFVEPTQEMLDPALFRKDRYPIFLNHKILPLGKEGNCIKIAFANPLDPSSLEVAEKYFGNNLCLFIAPETTIIRALECHSLSLSQMNQLEGGQGQIVSLVNKIIHEAIKGNASDIHIEPMQNKLRIRFRKDGHLIRYTDLSKDLQPEFVNRIKVMAAADISEKRRHQDGRILLGPPHFQGEVDLRVSFYITIFGENILIRILTKKAQLHKVEDLGMAPNMIEWFRDVLDYPTGVVIITGPTGAGKTTTLYAGINYCNKMDTKIITAEEPVEYVIDGISQCSVNPKIGVTFEESLRHMMRQDPDIIVLGEIRDKPSAESAIQAALTGHKVLTTFHTEDSIGGILRLINMDIETFLISSTVVSVVAQRLLRKVCRFCCKPYTPSPKELRILNYQQLNATKYNFQLGSGCSNCDFTGYQGRIGVFELLVLNEFIRDSILKRKTSYEIRRVSLETAGLVTLLEDGLAKAAKGTTSLPEVVHQLPILEPPRSLEAIMRKLGEPI